jgi:acetyl-CoA carboxylase carboxyltransferase component
VECPQPLTSFLSGRFRPHRQEANCALLEVMVRRYYRIRTLEQVATTTMDGFSAVTAEYDHEDRRIDLVALHAIYPRTAEGAAAIAKLAALAEPGHDVVADLFVWREASVGSVDDIRDELQSILGDALGQRQLRRVVVTVSGPEGGLGAGGVLSFTFRPDGGGGYREETLYRDLHPMMGKRLRLGRLDAFAVQRLPSVEDIYLFHGVAKDNPKDERLFALAEVRDLTPVRNDKGEVTRLPEFERVFHDVLGAIRRLQAHRPVERRLEYNRATLYVRPVLELTREEIASLVDRLAPSTEGIGLQSVEVVVRVRSRTTGRVVPGTLEFSNPGGQQADVRLRRTRSEPIRPLSSIELEIARLRRRGLFHPGDVLALLTLSSETRSAAYRGSFVEYDLEDGELKPVDRPVGGNTANIVVGVVSNPSQTYPEGMRRVILIGDPSRGMGSLAEPECRRIIAALDLADGEGIPLEWYAVSAGALISMDSGTENMDWIGSVLRRLIEFTQSGGEVNIVVTGVNVGAQPYWNAEATMLMHTKGILVMTPDSAMVLTGKQALDYSGGVSAEDNLGIGGYERIMGPNGQAQYFARGLADACRILLRHYDYTYVAPGERFPRRAETGDPVERNVEESPHGGDFALVGDVFSEVSNPGRKRPFDIRQVMDAVADQDHPILERWFGMQHAEVAVAWDARIGGYATCLLGFESRSIRRAGFVPADGPDQWTSGTLFPVASKKVARAINAASGNRPLVVLANLSGFDGSPESMRNLQLEYGAEIGRAVVNFDGPIVFCVISRYHGGAFVVFSNRLNDNLEIAAVEGSHASVIGGAPAAAVVFARDVQRRTDEDQRVVHLTEIVSNASGVEKSRLRTRLQRLRDEVYSEKLGEVAEEFDAIHNVERALEVGSVHRIISPSHLRPYLVDAIERGMARAMAPEADG